ncbi:hypothetical protein SEA_JUICYJAY_116 [Mycobacterium phage JuicyJay]|nr:hypothetical protein SEA_PHOEBUS_120 [Mycobacterium phage Phoebus]QDM57938.1 hypothetical protein SEA_NIHILNOMEN_121 [Mycobacterium phage NihilNomen]QZD97992.1 hypothetical protein SEA_BEEM_121 [Mycobacterium phage Beem]UEM46602.1 hypothetical protein SEA_JUICYJAY_116 [Mycobacterium phage JuicyJay]
MTAPLIESVDLSAYEFSIQCESPGCSESADFMAKGCADRTHRSLCHYHLAAVKRRFDQNCGKVVCDNCNRPWLFFETHYEVTKL